MTKIKTAAAIVLCTGLLTAQVGGSLSSIGTAQEANKPPPETLTARTDSDEEFIRRLSNDLRSSNPTPTEVYFFVANRDAGKRQKLIDLFIQERQAKKDSKPVSEWTMEEVKQEERQLRQAYQAVAVHQQRLAQAYQARQAVLARAIELNFRAEPWQKVFQWLSNQTLMPVTTLDKIEGTFTFISPPGTKFSLVEVIDILNESLLQENRLLLRRNHRFTVVHAGKKIDQGDVDFLQNPESLAHYGNTEIVRLVLQPKTRMVADLAPDLKKMVGRFGEVVTVASTNHLFLQDMVGNLKRLYRTVQELDQEVKEKRKDEAQAGQAPAAKSLGP